MIIDTHCHFDMMPHPEAYVSAKEKAGDIVIGMTNLPSHFKMGQPFLNSFCNVRLALGFHPLLAAENRGELSLFRGLVGQTSYIGEIGLDFSREGADTKDEQIIVLREILEAIHGQKKIVSVHSRRAERTLLDLLCEYDVKNVIFHWYTGPKGLVTDITEQGYYFSINEAMCLSRNGQEIIKRIPRDRMLTETDAPYNSRNNIRKALETIQMTEEDVRQNFMSLVERVR